MRLPRAAAPRDTSSGSPAPEGQVVKVEVTLDTLRDARLSASRVRKAAANLYDEVTRQQMTMNYNPTMVGTTVMSIPAPSFNGQILPARKKWVNAAMSEIGPIMNLFKEDVDSAIENDRHTDVSETTRTALDDVRKNAFAEVEESFTCHLYKQLERRTCSASGLRPTGYQLPGKQELWTDFMRALDKSMKKAISILQKEAKASKKSKNS